MRVRTEVLLDICEKKPELITNKINGPDGKAIGHALWQNVTHKLNSLGFGEKTTEEWRRALVDWKSETKAKAAKIKNEIGKTGDGPANYIPLSDLENIQIEIMGKKAIDGDEILEMGFGKITLIPVTSEGESYSNSNEHNYCDKIDSPPFSIEKTASTVTNEPSARMFKRKLADKDKLISELGPEKLRGFLKNF